MKHKNILEVKGLVKKFGDFVAVNGISFEVPRGTIYALLGPNGAGKTTTLRMILGILEPTEGEVFIDGVSVHKNPEVAKMKIGYMPQYHSLYEDLSVYENLAFYAKMYNLVDKERMREILEFVELWEFKDRLVGHLSGGMKQRASLACALIHDPELLVLDEPTAGVDPVVRQKMWEYFESLKKKGKTILVTTHYMDEASKADIIHLMRRGKTIMRGTLEEVIDAMYDKMLLTIKIKGNREIAEKVASLLNADKLETLGNGYRIYLSLEKGIDIRPILKQISDIGAKVLEVSTHRPSLEEAFVHFATKKGGEDEPL